MNKKGERVLLGKDYVGAKLARDVYKDRDTLLLSKEHKLTDLMIEKLRLNGVQCIYIEENSKL